MINKGVEEPMANQGLLRINQESFNEWMKEDRITAKLMRDGRVGALGGAHARNH